MNELTYLGNDIIPVAVNEAGEKVVSGRALHEKLGIKTEYRKWLPRMIEYGFKEGEDFQKIYDQLLTNGGRQTVVDHLMTVDMAYEIAMLQRTPFGKAIRQHLIDRADQLANYATADPIERAKMWIREQEQLKGISSK